MVCDGLDGRIARWTNTQSEFGKEYDSLSDMVAFGVAPGVVAYQWGVVRIAEYGAVWGRLGWLATFFYAACAAFRLARFNARAATRRQALFRGAAEPVRRRVARRLRLDAERPAARGPARAGARLRRRVGRRRPDDQPVSLHQRQGLQPGTSASRSHSWCWCRSASSLVGLEPARDVVRPVRPVRAVGAAARGPGTGSSSRRGATQRRLAERAGSGRRLWPARQAAYLEALGVDVYVRRGAGRAATQPAAPSRRPAPADDAPAAARGDPAARSTAATRRDRVDARLGALRATVAACERCELHATRTQTVFGVGDRKARWMFIGEAPGAEEDRQGEPFVGRAGQLLTSMLKALGPAREEVYIANVLKCRPPGNRDPRPEEARSCRGYLERQIELVDPTVIVAVGRIAAQNLLETDAPLARLRGSVHDSAQGGGRWSSLSPGLPAAQPGRETQGLARSAVRERRCSSDCSVASRCCRERRRLRTRRGATSGWSSSAR